MTLTLDVSEDIDACFHFEVDVCPISIFCLFYLLSATHNKQRTMAVMMMMMTLVNTSFNVLQAVLAPATGFWFHLPPSLAMHCLFYFVLDWPLAARPQRN